ncbi:MAG: rRNA maturation RNase YbeY [Bdellovibrionales bacterium]|nr:rRNA maturation RNase YbeY [Bdellovibrionales bacterium]
MKIEILQNSSFAVPEEEIRMYVHQILKQVKKRCATYPKNKKEIVIVFMDEKSAKDLNQQFRKKNYATDVLSFDPVDPESLGELVLCAQVVDRQAKEHELSFLEETIYLVIHGILHLLGYEHENDPEGEKEMMALQDEIFDLLV